MKHKKGFRRYHDKPSYIRRWVGRFYASQRPVPSDIQQAVNESYWKMLLGIVCALGLSSCVVATKDTYVSLGGKSAYKSATFGVVHDHNDSFREGALLGAVGLGAWQSVASNKAAEITSQVASKEATKTSVNASNNATALGIEGLKQTTAQKALEAAP